VLFYNKVVLAQIMHINNAKGGDMDYLKKQEADYLFRAFSKMRPFMLKDMIRRGVARWAMGKGGFSLIEMMVVVAIVAILSSIAVLSTIGNIDTIKADMTSSTVALTMSKARIRAISENNNYIVTFLIQNPPASGKSGCLMEIHDDNNRNGVRDTGEKVETEYLNKGVPFDLPANKDLYCINPSSGSMTDGIVFPDNKVTFYPRGNASYSGEIYIFPFTSKEKGRIWNRRAISLEKITGKPIVWKFDEGRDAQGLCPWVKK
jgi:prepilin-type N-terminal cleavage/methylation domain-containing protein